MEKNQERIYGQVFGTLDLYSEEHLEVLISTMDNEHALYYLVESVKAAFTRGAFTIGETEIISKAIRTISTQKESVQHNMNVVENQSNDSPGFGPE